MANKEKLGNSLQSLLGEAIGSETKIKKNKVVQGGIKMMKVLFLQPPDPPGLDVYRDWQGCYGTARQVDRDSYGHTSLTVHFPAFSIVYSAAGVEKSGTKVSFVDGQVEQLDLPDVVRRIEEIKPSVLVSLVNLPSFSGDIALIKEIRKNFPCLIIIVVGPVVRHAYKQALESGAVDYAILANPEEVLGLLLKVLDKYKLTERQSNQHSNLTGKKISNYNLGDKLKQIPNLSFLSGKSDPMKIVVTPISEVRTDFSVLPLPPYHLLPMDRYLINKFGKLQRFMAIWTSKGCSLKCSYYCPYPQGFGKKVQFKSPQRVLEEIELLVKKYKVEMLLFRDQVFTLNRKHCNAILDGIIKRKLPVRWFCETRLDMVDLPLLRKMYLAGCRQINYGLESGDPDILQNIGKPGVKIEEIATTIKNTRRAGIKPLTHVIVGLPGESWDTVKATLSMVKQIGVEAVHVSIATPYPGTQFYEDMRKRNFILSEDWSQYTTCNPVVRTEVLSAQDLEKASDYIYRGFHRPFHRRILKYFFSKGYLHRKTNKLKALFYYLISLYYHNTTKSTD